MSNQHISKVYDYKDVDGNLLFQVVRFEPKGFAQRRPLNNGFAWGLGEVVPVLYRLPEVLQAINDGKTIFICEGEKDADNLAVLGLTATTCPMGAGKWRASYTDSLKDCCEAVVLADKDAPGRAHAHDVASDLHAAGIAVKVIEMPDIEGAHVKDVSDWLSNGGTYDEFMAIVDNCQMWSDLKPSELIVNAELQGLIKDYGHPYYLSKDGAVTALNQAFWASLHQAEHIQLFEPDERVFYRYDPANGLYSVISEDVIKQEIASRILEVSRELVLPSLERKRTNSSLNHIVAHLKGISEKKNAFRRNKTVVHLANGVIVFKDNGEADFCSFSPEFYSRNQCPIPFDPTAKCERFLNELLYPAVTPDDAVLFQKYAGLSLLGNNLIQKFLILDGEPGRGKSTLVLVIRALIGQDNTTELRTKQLNERFELFRYLKRTLLTSVDVPGNFLSEKGAHVIKGLVGGDWFDAEQKGGTGSFPFQGNFCILITSNSRLQVRLDGDIGAWRRRLLIIRFSAPEPAKIVPDFNEVLIRDEGSGILNWALEGLGMLLKDIKERGTIVLTEAQRNIVDALLAESDSLRQFLIENVVSDEDADLTVPEIIEAYAEYCPLKGWHPKPITVIQRELERLMLELFKTTKSNSITREDEDSGKEKSHRGFRRVNFKKEEKRPWD